MCQDITSIQAIETLVGQILSEMEDVFLVSVRIKPTNNIKVFLDADAGLSIDKCVKINRKMYRTIEENAWYPDGNFSLEVSSAGVDEPLLLIRQYKKNMGRNVEVILNDVPIHPLQILYLLHPLVSYTNIRIKPIMTQTRYTIYHSSHYTDSHASLLLG